MDEILARLTRLLRPADGGALRAPGDALPPLRKVHPGLQHGRARALAWLQTMGIWAAVVVGVVLALVIAFKVWERRRLRRTLDQARISVDELRGLMDRGEAPVIVDVRTRKAHLAGHIPGALRMALEELDDKLDHLPAEPMILR